MQDTMRQLSITLPHKIAAQLSARVASGEYASESELIRESLRALAARDKAMERWLSDQIVTTYDAMKDDPSRAKSAFDVRKSLAGQHERADIPR